MHFIALATDYDGTLAEDGIVQPGTLEALRKVNESGRKLILVTGRELPDLQQIFPDLDRFDLVVAENGALLFDPSTGNEILLGPAPPPLFVERLRQCNVSPLSIGRSIVATFEPNEKAVPEIVRELGLELQIIFNKGAVMVLPPGVNKATGLAAALARLKLSPLNVVAIGDAENDHAFLQASGCAIAVANALPLVKADADLSMSKSAGAGVVELIERLITDDLAVIIRKTERQNVELARDQQGNPIALPACTGSLLIAGSSGGGKTTVATGLIERIGLRGFQFCVIDPEGDYAGLDGAITVGDAKTPPRLHEILELLEQPEQNVVVDLTGIKLQDRPQLLAELIPRLCELRVRTARPHWLVIDEAHHVLPPLLGTASVTLPRELRGAALITVRPEHVAPSALEADQHALTLGDEAGTAMRSFFEKAGIDGAEIDTVEIDAEFLRSGDASFWDGDTRTVQRVSSILPRAARLRHSRKYAEGDLGDDKSFYFRGPENRLNLRANNLTLFLQMADGVDDHTWMHHLRSGDYSRRLGEAINDPALANEVAEIEEDEAIDAVASRARIKQAIERRYTAPA